VLDVTRARVSRVFHGRPGIKYIMLIRKGRSLPTAGDFAGDTVICGNIFVSFACGLTLYVRSLVNIQCHFVRGLDSPEEGPSRAHSPSHHAPDVFIDISP
jgi:hypothetical protein